MVKRVVAVCSLLLVYCLVSFGCTSEEYKGMKVPETSIVEDVFGENEPEDLSVSEILNNIK